MKTDPPAPTPPQPHRSQPQRRVFDVVRPGRAPASPTSKPVIVGHKPQVHDPAVTLNGIAERRPLMNSHQKIAVQPVDESIPQAAPHVMPQQNAPATETAEPKPAAAAMPTPASVAAPTAAPAAPKPAVTPTPAVQAAAQMPEAPAPTPTPQPEQKPTPAPQSFEPAPAPTASPAPEPPAPETMQLTSSPADAADTLLDNMPAPSIQEQQVVISPHIPHSGDGTVWKLIIPIAIIVVVALVVLDVLLDAGFITMSVPHTHFFQ